MKANFLPIYLIIITIVLFSCKVSEKQTNSIQTICNPLDLSYRFQLDNPSRREAADPTMYFFKDTYYLFASKSGGYWHSKDLINWKFIETIDIPVNFNNLVNLRVTAFDANGNPIWAEIVVDDKLTGEYTPKEIAVRVGQRTIAAKIDGYILVNGERKLMVDSSPDEPIKFIFKKVL